MPFRGAAFRAGDQRRDTRGCRARGAVPAPALLLGRLELGLAFVVLRPAAPEFVEPSVGLGLDALSPSKSTSSTSTAPGSVGFKSTSRSTSSSSTSRGGFGSTSRGFSSSGS
jgi:hypothetical protein